MEALRATDPAVVGGRYRLLGRLGSGGMGTVYLGRSPGGRLIAVKCVHPEFAADPEFRHRFARELAAARQVGGFHTAQVVDADPDGDPPWLVAAYIPGLSLAESVAAHGPLPEAALRVLGAGLAEALTAIHAVGLVHRDLKPSNVLLAEDGPRVIDFGIARVLDGTAITRTQVVVGTPGYMAPEQITGDRIGPPCDVFSLGRVLCHAAGCAPFGQAEAQVMLYRIMHTEPDLSTVPEALRPTIAACLARDPEQRPTPAQLLERFAPPDQDEAGGAWLPAQVRAATTGVPGAAGVSPQVADEVRPAAPAPAAPATDAGSSTAPAPAAPTTADAAPALPTTAVPGPAAPVPPTVERPTGRTLTETTPASAFPASSASLAFPAPEVNEPRGVFGPPPPPLSPPPQNRRRRLPWVLVPLAVLLAAAGVCVPVFVLDGSTTPVCFPHGKGTGGPRPLVTKVPEGTPPAPEPVAPADRTTIELGQSVTLGWDHAAAQSSVVAIRGDDAPQFSAWMSATSCTFTPTATGLYRWEVSTGKQATGQVGSAWSEDRYVFVRAKGSSTPDPVRDAPATPRLLTPADQTVVKAGEPVTLRWSASSNYSDVSVQLPDGSWKSLDWQYAWTQTYTPPSPGVYVWVVHTANEAPGASTVYSAASAQRYLIVR